MLARRTIDRPLMAPPIRARPVAGAAAAGADVTQPDVARRGDALAGLLSRAVAGRGALLQRSPASAAKAMLAAKIDRFNKGTYEAWLAERSELNGKKGTNAVLHEVDAGHIKDVRIAYEALVAEAKAGTGEAKEEAKPTRFVATGKKAQAAAKLSAPVKAKQTVRRPPANEMTWAYGAEHGDLHFGGKPTKNKTKWSLAKPTAIELMEAEIQKHLDRMVRDSSVVEDEWTTWYIAYDPGYEVGKYFITPRESGSTNTFSMQVQVSLTDKHISFHGYPDEQVMGRGIGTTRNKIA